MLAIAEATAKAITQVADAVRQPGGMEAVNLKAVSYTHLDVYKRQVGVNVEGLKRRGFTPAQVSALRDAYKIIYRRGLSLDDARAELRARQQAEPEVAEHLQTLCLLYTSRCV